MKAIVQDRYGRPDVLRLKEIDPPAGADDQVLVRVRAAGVNPRDWHYMTGTPRFLRTQTGLRRPTDRLLGVDFAGHVESVGSAVTQFRPGDEVFGMRSGAFAEYVSVGESGALVHKPAHLTFEQASGVPVAALTALQGLRDKGGIQPGQRVLINGASGGVGTFAVQIAKSFGAEVTGVCSTRNVELVRSLGADSVIDYTKRDFSRDGGRYDLILNNVPTVSLKALKRVLTPEGTAVMASGPLSTMFRVLVASRFGNTRIRPMMTQRSRDDLVTLQKLLETGTIVTVIDRVFPLSEAPQALAYLGEGHARGKIIITC